MFYDVYTALCAENQVSESKAAESIGLNRSAVAKWKKGTLPSGQTIQKLADYFGVSADYLLGNVSEPYFYLDNERILRGINSYGDEDEEKASTLVSALLDRSLDIQDDLFYPFPPTREECAIGAYRAFQSLHSGKPADFSDIPPEHVDKVKKMYEFAMIASGLSDEDFDQLLELSKLLDKKDKRLMRQSTDEPAD